MDKPILKDQSQFPTEGVIYSCIGNTKSLWISFFDYIHQNHPDFTEEWKYYNDGKAWLLKVVKKTKTVFWVEVLKDTFRIGFYFTDKAEEAICKSEISDELKEQFKNGKRYGKIRGLSITFKDEMDIEYVKSLIPIRLMK